MFKQIATEALMLTGQRCVVPAEAFDLSHYKPSRALMSSPFSLGFWLLGQALSKHSRDRYLITVECRDQLPAKVSTVSERG